MAFEHHMTGEPGLIYATCALKDSYEIIQSQPGQSSIQEGKYCDIAETTKTEGEADREGGQQGAVKVRRRWDFGRLGFLPPYFAVRR